MSRILERIAELFGKVLRAAKERTRTVITAAAALVIIAIEEVLRASIAPLFEMISMPAVATPLIFVSAFGLLILLRKS